MSFRVPRDYQGGVPDNAVCFRCNRAIMPGDRIAALTSLGRMTRVYLCLRCHNEALADAQMVEAS